MKQVILWLILVALPLIHALTASPTFDRDPNVDAGECKAVNILIFLGGSTSEIQTAGTTRTNIQHFNKTDFTVVPRVIVGFLSYGIVGNGATGSTTMGHRFNITSTNLTHFDYQLDFFGVSTLSIHYKYLAVSGYDNVYYLEFFTVTFNSSSALRDSTATNRSEVVRLTNPQGYVTDSGFTSSTMLMNAWPVAFLYQPLGGTLNVNVTATPASTTEFDLEVFAGESVNVEEFMVSVLYFNQTALYEYAYLHFIDVSIQSLEGNGEQFIPDFTTFTDITNQYEYRNEISFFCGIVLPLTFDANPSYFYFNITTSANSIISGIAVQSRIRICGNSTLYFHAHDQLCYDVCPSGHGTNTTFNYCLECHYTCVECGQGLDDTSCNSCDNTTHRTLTNNSCPCDERYYDNGTALCVDCHYTCLTCSGDTISQCLTCSSADFRQLDSNTSICVCESGYFQNTSCFACIGNCLTCSFNVTTSIYTCLTCNTTQNKQVSSDGQSCQCPTGTYEDSDSICLSCDTGCTSCNSTTCLVCNTTGFFETNSNGTCSCQSGYQLNGSTCSGNVCGNGVLEGGEGCDDGDTDDGDGCSSGCVVETDHACLNDASVSSSSVCYYDRAVDLQVQSVYKVPNQNKVKVTMNVDAPNINQTLLEEYLSTPPAIELVSARRVLQTSDIFNEQSSYDSNSQTLSLSFEYSADIDLTTKQIRLLSSQSTASSSSSYFYSSPTVSIALYAPDNRLQTTFISDGDRKAIAALRYIYLIILIVWWALILVGVWLGQTAMVLQSFLVLQLTYEGLLQSEAVYDGWLGMILYGKYTYGYNVDYAAIHTGEILSVIDLSNNLMSTLNLTFALSLFALLFLVAIIVYEAISYMRQDSNSSEQNQTAARMEEAASSPSNPRSQQFKQKLVQILIELIILFLFVTPRIVLITLFHADASVAGQTVVVTLLLGCFYIAAWVGYYKCHDMPFMKGVSFRKITRNTNYSQEEGCAQATGLFTRHYYFIIFVLLLVTGFLNGATFMPIAYYIISIIGSAVFLLITLGVNVHVRKAHKVRTVINVLCLAGLLMIEAISNLRNAPKQQKIAAPTIGIVLLAVCLVSTIVVLVKIEYSKFKTRKRRESKVSKEKEPPIMITEQQELGKEEMRIQGDAGEYEREVEIKRDRLLKVQNFEDISGLGSGPRDNEDPIETHKRVAVIAQNDALPTNSNRAGHNAEESFEQLNLSEGRQHLEHSELPTEKIKIDNYPAEQHHKIDEQLDL